MTSGTSTDFKEVIFINQDAANAYRSLPPEVREAADARTAALQNGERLPAQHAKRLSGQLSGISEIRLRFDADAYRVYFAAEFEKAIYILDAGIKKSPNAGVIPRWQMDRLAERLAAARRNYERDAVPIALRFDARRRAREALWMNG
jgi:phage-related protein